MVVMSVYDVKGKFFVGGLQLHRNSECGIREFSTACQNKDLNLNKFPEDYELYLLGEFDENSGAFKLLEKPTKILTAKEVLANG